jgi:hypothetical protein
MREGVDIAESREIAASEEMPRGLPADVLVVIPDKGGPFAPPRERLFPNIY